MNKLEINELSKDKIYRDIAQEIYKKPYINVIPPEIMLTDGSMINNLFPQSVNKWNFPGKDGMRTSVIVFANGDEVELLVNGESYGRKAAGLASDFYAVFDVVYQSGLIEAINYRNKMEFSREVLQSD